MSARKIVVFRTSVIVSPAPSSTAAMFLSARSVCASTPSTSSPVAGSRPSCPEQKTRWSPTIPWLYGPMAAGAPVVVIARCVMRSSGSSGWLRGPDRCHGDRRGAAGRDQPPGRKRSPRGPGRFLGTRERRIERPEGRTGARESDRSAKEPGDGAAERDETRLDDRCSCGEVVGRGEHGRAREQVAGSEPAAKLYRDMLGGQPRRAAACTRRDRRERGEDVGGPDPDGGGDDHDVRRRRAGDVVDVAEPRQGRDAFAASLEECGTAGEEERHVGADL